MHSKHVVLFNCLRTIFIITPPLKYPSQREEIQRGVGGVKESDNSLLIRQTVVVIAVIALIIHTIRTLFECHNASALTTIVTIVTAFWTKGISFLNDKRDFELLLKALKELSEQKICPKRSKCHITLLVFVYPAEKDWFTFQRDGWVYEACGFSCCHQSSCPNDKIGLKMTSYDVPSLWLRAMASLMYFDVRDRDWRKKSRNNWKFLLSFNFWAVTQTHTTPTNPQTGNLYWTIL